MIKKTLLLGIQLFKLIFEIHEFFFILNKGMQKSYFFKNCLEKREMWIITRAVNLMHKETLKNALEMSKKGNKICT